MKTLIFLFLLMIVCFANNQCYPKTTITNLESGVMVAGLEPSNFVLNSSHNQFQYIYQLKQFHQSLPQVAICNHNYNSALIAFQVTKITGFAFQVLLLQSSQTQIKVKLVIPWQISQWNSLKFSIIINSRHDFQAGITTPKNWKLGDKQATIQFHKSYNDTISLIARPFLTGIYIETNSTSFSFQLMQTLIMSSYLIARIISDLPVLGIILSYIVFLPSSAEFTSYGGIVAQTNIQGTLYQSIQKSVSTLSNYLYGISGFSFKETLGRFSFTTSLDNRFVLTMTGNANDIIVSYVILGNNPSIICSHCIGTIPSYDACVINCQNGQIAYQYIGNVKGCIQCPLYAHMNNSLDNNNCNCQVGYSNVRGACLLTLNNNVNNLINLSAQELQLHFFDNIQKNKNVVTPTFITTPSLANNIQIESKTFSNDIACTDPNSYLSNGRCYCLPGFYLISQRCQKCPQGSYFNGSVCVSTVTQTLVPKQTQQLQIQNINNLTIQSTIQNQQKSLLTTTQSNIQLPQGALPLGNYSINSQNIELPPGALPHGNYSTIIQQSFKGVNPYLYKPTITSELNAVTVDLSDSKRFKEWECANINRKCPQSQKCLINEYLNKYGVCICKIGFIKNLKGICILSNYHDFPCSMQYAHLNSEGYCICQAGYAFNKNHNCIKIDVTIQCPIGGVLQYDGTCICIPPFFNNQGQCTLCQQGSFFDGFKCQVICPRQYLYDAFVRRCVCQKGFYQAQKGVCLPCPDNSITVNNICTACPPYSISDGNKCICIPGTTIKNGACKPICPINSFFSSQLQSCICTQENYYVNNQYKCVPCQKNTFYNGKACIYCVAPNWFDRSKKNCIACPYPSFYDNGNCYRCPENSQWDLQSRRCLCINGSISIGGKCQPSCINGVMINFKCFCPQRFRQEVKPNGFSTCIEIEQCIPPSFRNNQGRCIVCPINSVWDIIGQKCNCLNGYVSLNDKCVPFCRNGRLIGNTCNCNSGFYYSQNVKDCSICLPPCASCTNSSFCTTCLVGFPNQYGICSNNGLHIIGQQSTSGSWSNSWNSGWNSSWNNSYNSSSQSNSWNSGVALSCNVLNCKKCVFNNLNFCQFCNYPLIVLNNGQCGSQPICRTKNDCPFNYFCLVGQCVSQQRSSFTMNLISSVSSSIKQSKFSISITPTVTYFQQFFGSSWTQQSKTFIKISFQGLSNRQIPGGYCTQNHNLANWDCQIFYNNQPIAIPYNIILTAANPSNSNDIAYLLLTVNPVQANFSIEDATILMRTPGSLASMTNLLHTTYDATSFRL